MLRIRNAFVLAALAIGAPLATAQNRTPAQDAALLARVADAEVEFFNGWRRAWMTRVSQDSLWDTYWLGGLHATFPGPGVSKPGTPSADRGEMYMSRIRRAYATHCSGGWMLPEATEGMRAGMRGYAGAERLVPTVAFRGGLCPNWFRDDTFPEFLRADSLARVSMTGEVLRARTALIRLVDSAVSVLPSNGWLTGQQFRFHLDQDGPDSALVYARRCRTSAWWCANLTGYALALRQDFVAADLAFRVGIAAIAGEARCQWTDISVLLAPLDRRAYLASSCAQRESISANLWWLADPLLSVTGNERRVEHFSRKVSLALHSAVEIDELYRWPARAGGDAPTEMILRYGWPSKAFWGGVGGDQADDRLLGQFKKVPPSRPHLAPEYTRGRIHLVPDWSALLSPATSVRSNWSINPDSVNWWPVEHFMPLRPLVELCDDQNVSLRRDDAQPMLQIASDQTAVLRRDRGALFAYATSLAATDFSQRLGDSVSTLLMYSPAPDSVERIGQVRVAATDRVNFVAPITNRPAVMGFEIPNAGSGAVRTRFGVTPPPSLTSMRRGEVAISDPVLIESPNDTSPLSNDPAVALRRMLGSTVLPRNAKQVGVYWETYGFAPSDTVTIVLRVQRYTPQGLLRGLGNALSVTSDRNTPVATSWTEPQPGRAAHIVTATVPALARAVNVNIAGLPAGEYWLDLAVAKRGAPPVESRRSFVIRRD